MFTNKEKCGHQAGLLHPIPPGIRPFAVVHVDHEGPFVTTARKNTHILVATDEFTRFVFIRPVRRTGFAPVIKVLEDFILDFGAPIRFITDRGTYFTSRLFEEFCAQHGIRHTLNSPRHPEANGMVERTKNTLIPAIQASIRHAKGTDWDLRLKQVQRDLNSSSNQTTRKSPFELLFGFINRHDESEIRKLTDESDTSYKDPKIL